MINLFTDLRVLLVLFLLAALALLGGNILQAGDYNRPVDPEAWRRWGLDPPLPGNLPSARGAERSPDAAPRRVFSSLDVDYPANDCGHNHFLVGIWSDNSDCVPTRVFSRDCIKKWTSEYTKRYWRKVWRDEGLLEVDIAARLAEQGIAWGGVIGIYDEVIKDLIENTITCEETP